MKMRPLILGLMIALGGAGCQDWNHVELERSFGFCLGSCISIASLDTHASGTVTYKGRQGDPVPVTTAVAYPGRAGELDSAVDRALSITWTDHTGCPDCTDQGSFKLTVNGSDTRTTLLDPNDHPAQFDPLLAFFADVFAATPAPEPANCYSPTKNLDLAYTAGAIGCICTAGTDANGCFTDSTGRKVALICQGTRWASVEDGPCGI